VLYVPLEAVSSADGVPVVYRLQGGRVRKQEVVTGEMNEDEVVILRGLEAGDRVLLTPPPDRDAMPLQRLPGAAPTPPTAGGDTALAPRSLPPAAPARGN
jgi:HlyD family secretion protein